jgi:hypothetical protein
MLFPIFPQAFISIYILVKHLATTLSVAIEELSLVGRSITIFLETFVMFLVIFPGTLVDITVDMEMDTKSIFGFFFDFTIVISRLLDNGL